jgi:uncharacterized protein YndB with AHSA1/START domain
MAAANNSGAAEIAFPGDTQILITRDFDGPRHLVYQAWTTPDLIKRWWSGDRGDVTIAQFDLRPGGAWRYVTASGGSEVTFDGEYREVIPDERIVWTEMYAGRPEEGSLNHATFAEDNGRTTLTLLVQHTNEEHRSEHINAGMEVTMQVALDHLEQVVASLG